MLQLVKGAMNLQERFLCCIFRILWMSQQPIAIRIDPMFVLMVQLCECARFVDPDAFNKLFVCEGLHDASVSVRSLSLQS